VDPGAAGRGRPISVDVLDLIHPGGSMFGCRVALALASSGSPGSSQAGSSRGARARPGGARRNGDPARCAPADHVRARPPPGRRPYLEGLLDRFPGDLPGHEAENAAWRSDGPGTSEPPRPGGPAIYGVVPPGLLLYQGTEPCSSSTRQMHPMGQDAQGVARLARTGVNPQADPRGRFRVRPGSSSPGAMPVLPRNVCLGKETAPRRTREVQPPAKGQLAPPVTSTDPARVAGPSCAIQLPLYGVVSDTRRRRSVHSAPGRVRTNNCDPFGFCEPPPHKPGGGPAVRSRALPAQRAGQPTQGAASSFAHKRRFGLYPLGSGTGRPEP